MEKSTGHPLEDFPGPSRESNGTAPGSGNVLADINLAVWHVAPPLLLVFGTFGNVMTVQVMRGMRASQSTACLSLYFTALAVSDQCVLTSSLMWFWVDRAFYWPRPFLRNGLMCGVPKFVRITSGVTSAWFLVAMTYQRVTSVVAPHRVQILCTVRRGKVVVATIVVLSCALCLHFVFTWSYLPGHGECRYVQKYIHFVEFEWVELVCASMTPFLLLASGNFVLIRQVVNSTRLTQAMRVSSEGHAASRGDKTQSMSTTLILTSAAFLVLTLPICVFHVLLHLNYIDGADDRVRLGESVALLLWISSCATNFYLYMLSGNKFRQEAKRCLRCRSAELGK